MRRPRDSKCSPAGDADYRWGKTRLGVFECIDVATRGGRAWWVAPSYRMSEVGWRPLRRMGAKIPGAEVRKVDRQVNLPGGGQVAVRSADKPDSLRGEGLDFLVIDECAFISEEAWTEALRPALSDRQGRAMFISTPKGRNWFWKLYNQGADPDNEEWQSWSFATGDNPHISGEEIAAARATMPERIFQQEYMAKFLEGEGQVFRNIYACMIAPDTTPEEHAGHHIAAGVDWGRQEDYTAISVGCATCEYELAKDRFNTIEYAYQRGRLRALAKRWGINDILVETNSIGAPNLEMLQRDGLPARGFATTATTKPPLIENLGLTLEQEDFQFIPDPVWTMELEAFEQTITRTGRPRYSAPDGFHDDTVIARALMLRAIQGGRLQVF